MNQTAPVQVRQHSKSFTLNTTTKLNAPIQPKRLEKSFEEIINEKQLSNVEKQRLKFVYDYLVNLEIDKSFWKEFKTDQQGITVTHLIIILDQLGYQIHRQEAELIIWEADEDGDGVLSEYEFELMYKRCIFDTTMLEPRNLFNIIQFLMYDKTHKGKITVEDTLELLFVRYGRYRLDDEIYQIFGTEEKTSDGQEKSITFTEYYEQVKRKDFNKRKEIEQDRKTIKLPSLDETK